MVGNSDYWSDNILRSLDIVYYLDTLLPRANKGSVQVDELVKLSHSKWEEQPKQQAK
jgi:hypothetical protein